MYFWAFLFLLLLALLIAVVPVWPYSRRWGYAPTLVAVAVLIGLLALSYIGYIGPWQQDGPPFVAGTADDTPGVVE
jgi:Protein of unknown function (DUF3309)